MCDAFDSQNIEKYINFNNVLDFFKKINTILATKMLAELLLVNLYNSTNYSESCGREIYLMKFFRQIWICCIIIIFVTICCKMNNGNTFYIAQSFDEIIFLKYRLWFVLTCE